MRDPFLEELPSREKDGIEMEELQRNNQERDEMERGRRKRRREEEHRGYKRSRDEPVKRLLRPRIPATYEEFNPEWEEDGKVQNEKYSRIEQLGGTSDQKEQGEGESGSNRPDPHLLREGKPTLFRNLESLRIVRDSQNEDFVHAKPSDRSKVWQNSTTKNHIPRDKKKSSQWSKIWRVSMLILTCLLLLVPGTATGTSSVPKYTVRDWELGCTECTPPTKMLQYHFLYRCTEPENMVEPVKKRFPGVPVTPRRIRIID